MVITEEKTELQKMEERLNRTYQKYLRRRNFKRKMTLKTRCDALKARCAALKASEATLKGDDNG